MDLFYDMIPVRILLITINTISTFLALYTCIATWNRREKAGNLALYLSLSMMATTIYAFGYTMELASNTLDQILFWVKIEHLGIEFISPFWLLFALSLSGRQKMLSSQRISALFIVPIIMVVFVFLGKMHLNPQITAGAPFPTLSYTRGTVALIEISYACICLIISLIILTAMYMKAAPTFRKQALIFALSATFPLLGIFITATNHAVFNLDLAPLSISISGILFVISFHRLQIFDIVPLARDVVFEGMGDGILVFDTSNRLLDFNPRTKNIFSEIKDSSVGSFAKNIFNTFPDLVKMIQKNSSEKLTLQNGAFSYRCSMMPLYYPKGKMVGKVITIQDYTQTTALVKQLRDLATMDYLTGIYNRRHFYELAEKEISRTERLNKNLSLIIFDLDRFKLVNDTLGHSAGDTVLKFIVDLSQQRLRKYDIMGRFGGDEFLILLPETDLDEAHALAEELRSFIEQSEIPYEEQTIKTTASFGVASLSIRNTSSPFEDLVKSADKAIYIAKDNGRNRVSVDQFNIVNNKE